MAPVFGAHEINLTVQVEVDGSGKAYCFMYDLNWVDQNCWLNLTCHGPQEVEFIDKGFDTQFAWWKLCMAYAESGQYLTTKYNTIKMEVPNSSAYKIHHFDNYFGFDVYYL